METIIAQVVPNWEVESPHYQFDVSINKVDDDWEVTEELFDGTVGDFKLFEILAKLSTDAETKGIKTNVFAYHHGNKGLLEYYWDLIRIFDKKNFHMEYEWG